MREWRDIFGYEQIPLGTAGIYIFKHPHTQEILYVGKANDLRKRLYQYTSLGYGSAAEKFDMIQDAINDFPKIDVVESATPTALEQEYIDQHHPMFNVRINESR